MDSFIMSGKFHITGLMFENLLFHDVLIYKRSEKNIQFSQI